MVSAEDAPRPSEGINSAAMQLRTHAARLAVLATTQDDLERVLNAIVAIQATVDGMLRLVERKIREKGL